MVILQIYPLSGEIGFVLQQWAEIGVFTYVLPFLLLFAIIYAILDKIHIFTENKGVNAVIAMSIALLALTFPGYGSFAGQPFVPAFFSIIFPQLGVGLAILITALILLGVFIPLESLQGQWGWGNYILLLIGIITFLAILFNSFSDYALFGFGGSYVWQVYGNSIIAGIILLIIIILFFIFNRIGRERRVPPH